MSGMYEQDPHGFILSFLRKMGYRQTEHVLKEESKALGIDASIFEIQCESNSGISNLFLHIPSLGDNSSQKSIKEQFEDLLKWSHESLDVFRDDIQDILYPIYIHTFLDLIGKNLVKDGFDFLNSFIKEFSLLHGDEIEKLSSLSDASHLKENNIAFMFRTNKYNVSMSSYAFQLLMNFLQDEKSLMFIKIVNHYIRIKIYPLSGSGKEERIIKGIVGDLHTGVHRTKLEWGVYPVDPRIESEVYKRLRQEVSKVPGSKTPEQVNYALQAYRKIFTDSIANVRKMDSIGIPLTDIPEDIIDFEVRRIKDISLKSYSSPNLGPSATCFTLQNYGLSCTSTSFSSDFSLLAVGSNNSYIDIWTTSGSPLRTLKPSTELAALDLNNISSLDEILESNESCLKRLVGHSGPVSSLKFSRDSLALLSSSFDCSIRLWSTITFDTISVYRSHAYPVWDVDFSPLGHYFVSASADRTARLWNIDYSNPVRLFAGHFSEVDCVKFHPNGCYIASGSSDKSCRIWDVTTGNCVRLFPGHNRTINSLAFSKNGRILASGDLSGRLYLYDIAEGKQLWRSEEPSGKANPILSVDFSNDDKSIAVSYSNSRIQIFSTEDLNRKPVDFYTKQTPIYYLRFNPRDVLMCAGPFIPE